MYAPDQQPQSRPSADPFGAADALALDLAERALRTSERRFRQMTDLLPQPVYEADRNGVLTFSNRAGFRMFGYREEELRRGVRILDLVAPEDRDRAGINVERIMRGEAGPGHEYAALRRDGSTLPVIVFSAPIVRDDGLPDGLRGIVIDITERVQTEEVLRETALKFRQLADSISEVFFIKDARTRRTLFVSPAYETIWGRTCRSFYDRPESFRESVHPDDRNAVVETLERQGLGMPTQAEYRIIRPDGAVRWIRSKTFPVRNGSGALYRIVGVAEDITERKESEEALRTQAARLRALSARLADVREAERRSIARELHDEIGQIATGLKLGIDLLTQTAGPAASSQVAGLQAMAVELISEVRNLSLGLRPSMLDDLGLLPALSWLFKRSGEQTGIAVEFTHRGVARRFNAETETVVYRAVQEAITNAVRHADADRVTVDLAADDAAIFLVITDLGRGFDRGQVLASPLSTGLFGMQERVDAIGGTLDIRSSPGAGTRIAIRLPVANPPPQRYEYADNDPHR